MARTSPPTGERTIGDEMATEDTSDTTVVNDPNEDTKTAKQSAQNAEDAKAVLDGVNENAEFNEAARRRMEPQAYVLVSDDENGEGDARRVDVDGSVTSPPEGSRFATPEQINKYNRDRIDNATDEDPADTDGVDVTPTAFRP